jgi:HK97 family phage major capsid protein
MSEKVITMTEDEVKDLTSKLGKQAGEKINDLFAEAKKGNEKSLDEVKNMIAEISKIESKGIHEYMKAVQEQANQLEAAMKEMKNAPKHRDVDFKTALGDDLMKHADKFKVGKGQGIEFKTVADMSIVDNLGAGVVAPLYLAGITGPLKRRVALYELLNKVPWATDTVTYVEAGVGEGTIAARREAAASYTSNYDAYAKFPQVDYDFVARTMTLSKIPAYSKVTNEMLENAANVVSYIQNELLRDVLIKLETDIISGNGSAPTMKGLQHSDHYTAAAIPGSFTLPSGITPNEGHVLRAIITQGENGYVMPNAILMNPTDIMKLDMGVDKNGQYLIPPFASRDNTSIKGVSIIPVAGISAGYFHVIDSSRINLYVQRGLNLNIWDQVGSDPLYDLKTITASVKAGVLVKNNEKIANIYGQFSTLIAAMTAGS